MRGRARPVIINYNWGERERECTNRERGVKPVMEMKKRKTEKEQLTERKETDSERWKGRVRKQRRKREEGSGKLGGFNSWLVVSTPVGLALLQPCQIGLSFERGRKVATGFLFMLLLLLLVFF